MEQSRLSCFVERFAGRPDFRNSLLIESARWALRYSNDLILHSPQKGVIVSNCEQNHNRDRADSLVQPEGLSAAKIVAINNSDPGTRDSSADLKQLIRGYMIALSYPCATRAAPSHA
jgi:hypothetical protein